MPRKGISYDRIRKLCLSLPDVEERLSHGSPTFFTSKRTFLMFANNHHGDGRIAVWCNASEGGQEILVGSDPDNFFIPPYVGPGGWIGVNLDKGITWAQFSAVVKDAYATTRRPRRR
jgi:hypothetical protein